MDGDPRVLVCGGRLYADRERVFDVLDRAHPAEICHGGARGADALAGEWAAARGVPCTVFPADWHRFGRRAGHLRNRQMLGEFKPDLVVAFPGGPGTEGMVVIAERARVTVMLVSA